MRMTNMKPWMAVGALVAAGAVLVGCSSSGDMKDVVTDEAGIKELIAKGFDGEETVKCTGDEDGAGGEAYIGSERRIMSTRAEDGMELSVLLLGDEMYRWVDGEEMGVVQSGPMVQEASAETARAMKADTDGVEKCGVYTGSNDVFKAPSSVDFVTPTSETDLIELEESAPKLAELLSS